MELKELIREANRVEEIVGQCTQLNIDGAGRLKGLCPLHRETAPSFIVYLETQSWYCFGCNKGGDVFDLVMLREGIGFWDAQCWLAKRAGLPFPKLSPEEVSQAEGDRAVEDALSLATEFYQEELTGDTPIGQRGRDYLYKRGITSESIQELKLGIASGSGLRAFLRGHEVKDETALRAGLIKDHEGKLGDFFRRRIMFPCLRHGRTSWLVGRALGNSLPKYLGLATPKQPYMSTLRVGQPTAILVEGPFDAIALRQWGYSAIALLGTAIKEEWLPQFGRFDPVYVCLDPDIAGEDASLVAAEKLGTRSRLVQLPEGVDDPADFVERGHAREEFGELLAKAPDIIKYALSRIPPDVGKTELPQRLEPILKKLARMDRVKAEAYLSYEVKPRFKLKKQDIDGYRELVNKYRRGEAEAPNIRTAGLDAKPAYTAHFDELVDIVEHNGSPAFLTKEGESLAILSQVEKYGSLYIPPPKAQIPWLLPRGEEVLSIYELQEVLSTKEYDRAIYDDLLAYHKAISDLPGKEYYDLIVAWDLHTYLFDVVQYSPIICLFAVPERGKSRTGKGMIHVAFRGIHVESLRDAYLVRVANDLGASLFFDVKDIWKKAEQNGSEDILLHRFERGAKVPRVLYPDRGAHQDIVYYSIFGPTIISTNEGVHRILETRAVSINLPGTRMRFENDVTPELALPLKERLTAFRARHLGETLPDIPKPAAGRLGDILKPLQQVIRLVKPEREPAFLKLVGELEEEKLIEKADSLEAQILTVLIGLKDRVERGILPVKEITDAFNKGKSEKGQVTYQRVGRRLLAMGFKKARAANNAAILWDEEKIGGMIDAYGWRETHETQEKDETRAPIA